MKILHIVPGLEDAANGMAVVARFLANEQGNARVIDLSRVEKGDVASSDEIWVHGMWLPKEWQVCRWVLKAKKLLVRMPHGSLSPVYLKYQSPFKKRLAGPIERWALRRCKKLVATCDAEKAWIEAYLGKKCPEIVVEDVKRFFDFSRKERKDRKENEGNCSKQETGNKKLNVLYLGRRHPLKGVEYLEKAVDEINDNSRSRESSSRPLRVGATRGEATKPSDREAELNSGIGNFSYEENLSIHCSTSTSNFDAKTIDLRIVSDAKGEELAKVWDWCDVLVLPTLSENFGLVVAEALERGKRVITTDGAPVWECSGRSYESKLNSGVGNSVDERDLPVRCLTSTSDFDSNILSRYGGRLLYLKGYRDGSEEERVRLLKDALMMMV